MKKTSLETSTYKGFQTTQIIDNIKVGDDVIILKKGYYLNPILKNEKELSQLNDIRMDGKISTKNYMGYTPKGEGGKGKVIHIKPHTKRDDIPIQHNLYLVEYIREFVDGRWGVWCEREDFQKVDGIHHLNSELENNLSKFKYHSEMVEKLRSELDDDETILHQTIKDTLEEGGYVDDELEVK
tara:strand:+ start:7933 stop:8481 length:549 start_codon:yes stop_codon:yes gene_type:complete